MSGGSYLNSSVSLISKASVRYEGTLYSIDPQEATITLSKVRSFGTEQRKLEGFIAPSDTVFDFIIFNANDIKELIVDEPLNDPAIVTAQMPTSTTKNANSGFSESQSNQQNGVSEQAGLKTINRQSNLPNVSSAGQNDCFKSRGSTPSSSQARSPTSELSSNKQKTESHKTGMNRNQNQHNRNNNMNNNRKTWDNRGSNFYNNQRFDNRNNNRNLNYNNNMNRRPGNYQNNNYSNYNQRNQGYRRNDDRVSNMPNKNGFRNNNNNMNNRGVRKFNQPNKKVDPTLKTEFDFERANEVFQQMVEKLDDLNLSLNGEKAEKSDVENKEETKNEIEKVDKADEESNFYDKTKSFFDNISCEAAERSKGTKNRMNWKQERELNAETFGFKITYRRNNYNGGYRPRPNYNNNNNNNNNRNVPNRRYNNNNNNGNRNTTRINSS